MTDLKSFSSGDALARAVARDWLDVLAKSSGPHHAAVSGGRITVNFFRAVAELARAAQALQNVHFWWADERCVPPDHPDSNFRLAKENLFDPLSIAPDKIHRLRGELPPAAAVAQANAAIQGVSLDLIFLGLGEDGHTASLMPNAPESVMQSRAAYAHIEKSPKPPPDRISLTYAAIAAAKEVWMLASGDGKQEALRKSLRADGSTPFGRVLQQRGPARIYSDISL